MFLDDFPVHMNVAAHVIGVLEIVGKLYLKVEATMLSREYRKYC